MYGGDTNYFPDIGPSDYLICLSITFSTLSLVGALFLYTSFSFSTIREEEARREQEARREEEARREKEAGMEKEAGREKEAKSTVKKGRQSNWSESIFGSVLIALTYFLLICGGICTYWAMDWIFVFKFPSTKSAMIMHGFLLCMLVPGVIFFCTTSFLLLFVKKRPDDNSNARDQKSNSQTGNIHHSSDRHSSDAAGVSSERLHGGGDA